MRHEVVVGAAFWFLVSAFVALSAGRARGDAVGESRRASLTATQPSASREVQSPSAASVGGAEEGPSRELRTPSEGSQVDEAWQQFHGQVLFSNILFAPPGEFPSAGARAASLRRTGRNTVESTGGFWRLHCVAFLDPMPKGSELRVRATDVTDTVKPHEVRIFRETIVPGQKELTMDDLVLTDTIGFQAGHRYEISIERGDEEPGVAPAGKRDVYAKGVVTLM